MKLAARIKSVIKRRARQQSAKRRLEIPHGSLIDMEKLYIGQPEAEQRVYGRELSFAEYRERYSQRSF